MGSLVVAHVVRAEPSAQLLARLPRSLGWAAYHAPVCGAVLIDVFGSDHAPAYPFARLPRSLDLAEELSDETAPLNALYEALLRQRRASPFRRRFVNLNLLLSRALEMPVLSLAADDDGLDLACLSANGLSCRLRFKSGGLEIVWQEGRGVIQPLVFDDDSAVSDGDLRSLVASLPGCELRPPLESISLLHRIASEECKAFVGADAVVPGLGTWDEAGRALPMIMRSY